MSRPYVYQCYAWPTIAASIPNTAVSSVQPYSTRRMIFLTLTTIFLNTDIQESGPPATTHVWEICYPTNQLSGLIRSAQLAIYGLLCDFPVSPIPALRDLTVRLMGCINDMVTNLHNTQRTILPMAALFWCTPISATTAALALPATVFEEEEYDEEIEDEEEEEEEEEVKGSILLQVQRERVTTVTSCSICLVDIGIGEMGAKLPCEHLFHEVCIVKWIKKDFSCPNCRFRVD